MELHWPDGREQLVVDMTLAHLPTISAAELTDTIRAPHVPKAALRSAPAASRDHAIDRVLADRRVSGTAG
jgi:hypothetical protein